jgi:hypothetical protein
MRPTRGLAVAAALTCAVALLAATGGAASAATVDPTTADFGRVLIGHNSAPKTFTVTKGAEPQFVLREGVINGGFFEAGNTCPNSLTPAAPSCTITVQFQAQGPGPAEGTLYTDDSSGPPIAPEVHLTGIGVIAANDFHCQKKFKKKWFHRYCLKKKK